MSQELYRHPTDYEEIFLGVDGVFELRTCEAKFFEEGVVRAVQKERLSAVIFGA